jgi:hypothetical protein
VLKKVEKTLNLPLLLIEEANDAVNDITKLLKNPFDFLLTLLR